MMQLHFFKRVSYIAILLLFSACTEEIFIDLNSSNPQVVIEGNISNNGIPAVIKITKSVNFDESNTFPKVSGATVTLSDLNGNSEILNEISPGVYSPDSLLGTVNNTYFLTVETDGQELSSNSTMPIQVAFEDLIVEESKETGSVGPGIEASSHDVIVKYTDPAEEVNYYRFIEYVNGELKGSYIFDDRLTNGLSLEQYLRRGGRDLKPGDILKVEMQCVDKYVHEYFFSINGTFGGPASSSTPYNPVTNILGSELGYFNAHTFEVKEIIIQ